MSGGRQSDHDFSRVPQAEIPRSSFDRSHGHKTTFDTGYLNVIFCDEVIPGDTFNLSMSFVARLTATALQRPIMDNLYLDSFFFFCPLRLIWTNFPKFHGEQANPADSTSYSIPQMTVTAAGVGQLSLSDQMGIPIVAAAIVFNSLWHRAYNLTWNQWFRDENLQNSVVVDLDDGPDTLSDYVLLRRGKRHDYFTSCLPWPQKSTAVSIPLGSSATVKTQLTEIFTGVQEAMQWRIDSTGGNPTADRVLATGTGNSRQVAVTGTAGGAVSEGLYPTNLYADLTNATAATINSLRQAFQLQKLYERDARGGTRYTEIIKSHFGVTSPDARLQRVEYLGGGSTPINIHPVAGTNQAGSGATAAGQLTAFGTAVGSRHGFTKSFTEHGVILGLVSVRAELSYQQGLNRMFSRRTRFDTYYPALAFIGEQAVLNKEIWMDGSANDDLTFGYQERWAEMRYKPSLITGKFRSDATGTLDVYHLAQDFAALPTLGSTFIQDTPPVSRVVAVTTEPQVLFDGWFNLICARPMPVFGVPGNIDRF